MTNEQKQKYREAKKNKYHNMTDEQKIYIYRNSKT